MGKLSPANEPIGISTVAVIISWLSGRYALDLDTATASAISVIVLVVAQWLARRFSTPVGKAEAAVTKGLLTEPTTATVAGSDVQSKEILATSKA